MRKIFTILFMLFPSALTAENITVQSGEHADFSRIVIQFGAPVKWVFGRVDGGYEFRSNALEAEFDVSKVFDLIPKTRIQAVSSPGQGRLLISVDCNCVGDAFEIRNGRIVLDIKEGKPDNESQFESVLPELDSGAAWPQTQTIVVPDDNYLASSLAVAGGFQFGSTLPNERVIATQESNLPLQIHLDSMRMALVEPEIPGPLLPTWPLTLNDTVNIALPEVSPDRVALAKKVLLEQFGRAASQGIFSIEHPEISSVAQVETSAPKIPDHQIPRKPADIFNNTPINRDHLRVETVFDREGNSENPIPALTNVGSVCLGPELFEISEWGPENISSAPYGTLRTLIVLEFDEPDPDAIINLARRYLFLGFGAEAIALLNAFDVNGLDAGILIQIAEIIDNDEVANPESLLAQLNCQTSAAMWGILAARNIPNGELVDSKSVLRTFSGLPPHLRERLGPWLAERFLKSGDLHTATSIRNIIDRAIGERGQRFQLMDARLSSAESDGENAMRLLTDVANSRGAEAGMAIVELIENRLDLGLRIDEDTALLAESMATEHRETGLGRKLTQVAIRGLAGSGQIEATFDRIEAALRDGQILSDEADELSTEAHLTNAQSASDSEFLKSVFRQGNSIGNGSSDAQFVMQEIAARLISLGMPSKVIQMYASTDFDLEDADRQILAEAYLVLGDDVGASNQLNSMDDNPSQLLLARVKETKNEFLQAAQIFESLELNDEYESSIWRGGDWQAVAQGGIAPRIQAADLILNIAPVLAPSLNETQTAGTDISEDPPELDSTRPALQTISTAKKILEQSSVARATVENLLTTR